MDFDPPHAPKTELAVALIKGSVGLAPGGGLVAEVANLFFNPIEKRKQKWMALVAIALKEIETKFRRLPDDLEGDEKFISLLSHATLTALQNHHEEKLRALQRAVVSAANPESPAEDVQLQFLRYVDELSATHLRILACLTDHIHMISMMRSLLDVIGGLRLYLHEDLDPVVCRAFLHDLNARSLIAMVDLEDLPEFESKQQQLVTESSTTQPLRVTSLGRRFLNYIETPKHP